MIEILTHLWQLIRRSKDNQLKSKQSHNDQKNKDKTIEDPEATSLRAIKLPDEEREELDAEDRDS